MTAGIGPSEYASAPRGPCVLTSPGGGPLVNGVVCFHCQSSIADGSHSVTLRTPGGVTELLVCPECQSLRQEGQLPVELLLQQWYYAQDRQDLPEDLFASHQVSLVCLGCEKPLAPLPTVSPGASTLVIQNSRRMPDGSVVVSCSDCNRTNVLEGRSSQLIAVRLW